MTGVQTCALPISPHDARAGDARRSDLTSMRSRVAPRGRPARRRRGMSFAQKVVLAWRLLLRDWRAGEVTLLVAALVIAVAAVTTVSFFTDRVQLALTQQSNQLLGADLSIVSDRPFAAEFTAEAKSRGLEVTGALRFPSMASARGESQLVDIRSVGPGYPLRGEIGRAHV